MEFFTQDLPTTEGNLGESLAKRLFKVRLELIGDLDKKIAIPQVDGIGQSGDLSASYELHLTEAELRKATVEVLRSEVAAMNVNNFVVRPKRRLVEKYASGDAWNILDAERAMRARPELAGLRE